MPLYQVFRSVAFNSESLAGESSADLSPAVAAPPESMLDKNLIEAASVHPEVTVEGADVTEQWPLEGYKAKTFEAEVRKRFFNRAYELQYINDLFVDTPDQPILLLAVQSVGAAPARDVKTAWFQPEILFKRSRDAEFTKEDYKTAIGLIAAAPYHAVQMLVLLSELEKDKRLKEAGLTGAQVLISMIEYNVLSVCPYSEIAKDIPREVFVIKDVEGLEEEEEEEEEDSVVVMPSLAHLHAALKKIRRAQKFRGVQRLD